MSDSGLGHQRQRQQVKKRIDEGGKPPDESKRPTEPMPHELKDPVLVACRRAQENWLTVKDKKGKTGADWEKLYKRNRALRQAESLGHSLRSIARMTGMTHAGVRNIILYSPMSAADREARNAEPYEDVY